jgi:hypothetical protein
VSVCYFKVAPADFEYLTNKVENLLSISRNSIVEKKEKKREKLDKEETSLTLLFANQAARASSIVATNDLPQ